MFQFHSPLIATEVVAAHLRMVKAQAVARFKQHHITQGAVGFATVNKVLRPIYLGESRIPRVKRSKHN